MLDRNDIMETIKMISEEHLDIRTVTMGISLLSCAGSDADAVCEKVYAAKLGLAVSSASYHTAADYRAVLERVVRLRTDRCHGYWSGGSGEDLPSGANPKAAQRIGAYRHADLLQLAVLGLCSTGRQLD